MKDNIVMFDYITLSQRYSIEPGDLKKIVDEAHNEFKNDEMMAELHIVKAIRHTILKNRQGALT